jgi:methanogenic corrinoid protein MtbC1
VPANTWAVLQKIRERYIYGIGKNIVKIIFDATSWEVYDPGADVKIARFVKEQKKSNPMWSGFWRW